MNSSLDTKSESSLAALSQGDGAQDTLPSYSEASTSSQVRVTAPTLQSASAPNPQRYSSLLPPSEEASPGPPPNYEVATSSLPDRIRRRPRTPEEPESSERRSGWLHIRHHQESSANSNSPPEPEGVPLEEVVDKFGNRKRELKLRSLKERIQDPVNVRSALRRASKISISYYL